MGGERGEGGGAGGAGGEGDEGGGLGGAGGKVGQGGGGEAGQKPQVSRQFMKKNDFLHLAIFATIVGIWIWQNDWLVSPQ